MNEQYVVCSTVDPGEQSFPVKVTPPSYREGESYGVGTIVVDKRWTIIFCVLAGVMAMLGIALLISSIHIQTESEIDGLHRIGAMALSLCAMSYFVAMNMAVRARRLTYIPMRMIMLLSVTLMAHVLVFGIAKGASSKMLGYNVFIGVLAGMAAVTDVILMVIQHLFGTQPI